MATVLTARLDGGRFLVQGWNRFLDRVKRMQKGIYTVTIERQHSRRSPAQNALYWSVYIPALVERTGFDADEIHEILKAKFLPKSRAFTDGNGVIVEEFVLGGSTGLLYTDEFNEYLRRISEWARTLDVEIPEAS
jgi:hypothetical protein